MRFSRASIRLAKALDRTIEERDEARSWARHGYEIGQRSATWSDHGVAPTWLTEGHSREALELQVRHDTSQKITGVDFRPCVCDEAGRCEIAEHYWGSGVAQGGAR